MAVKKKKDRILIIDDSRVQAEFLRDILKEEYEVSMFTNPEEGLKCAKGSAFSMILLDVFMPGVDGFMVLKELKETPVTSRVPVMMITSLHDNECEEKGLTMGAVDYVRKPFNATIVKARVRTHVQLFGYRRKLEEQALFDELTGIANRRNYEETVLRKWREAVRLRLSFSVCMIDIDRFKCYNDRFGHPAGDHVLADVAGYLSGRLRRATDFLARYGGEEFVGIFLNEEPKSLYGYMRELVRGVEALGIAHDEPSAGRMFVTVSMGGISVFPSEGDRYESVLKMADLMLYEAKRFGRNQVVWSDNYQAVWSDEGCESEK